MTDQNNGFYLDNHIYAGRPTAPTGRLDKELRTYDLLNQLYIPYERANHSPTHTVPDCHDIDQLLNIEICKNLFLKMHSKPPFTFFPYQDTKSFAQQLFQSKLISPDSPLHNRNLWKNYSTYPWPCVSSGPDE